MNEWTAGVEAPGVWSKEKKWDIYRRYF